MTHHVHPERASGAEGGEPLPVFRSDGLEGAEGGGEVTGGMMSDQGAEILPTSGRSSEGVGFDETRRHSSGWNAAKVGKSRQKQEKVGKSRQK